MKKTESLKKNYEFKMVLTRGKRYSERYIDAFFINNKLSINKIGIAIGKSQVNAVKRNRIKRLIREAYRLNENNIETGKSIVFLVKKKINFNEINFENIQNDVINILRKIGQV